MNGLTVLKLYAWAETIELCARAGYWRLVAGLKVIKVKKLITEYETRASKSTCVLCRRLSIYFDIVKHN